MSYSKSAPITTVPSRFAALKIEDDDDFIETKPKKVNSKSSNNNSSSNKQAKKKNKVHNLKSSTYFLVSFSFINRIIRVLI